MIQCSVMKFNLVNQCVFAVVSHYYAVYKCCDFVSKMYRLLPVTVKQGRKIRPHVVFFLVN